MSHFTENGGGAEVYYFAKGANTRITIAMSINIIQHIFSSWSILDKFSSHSFLRRGQFGVNNSGPLFIKMNNV